MRNWLFAFLIVVPSLAIAQIAPIPIGPNAGGGGGGGGGGGVSSLATTCPTTGAATGAVTLSGLLNVDLQTVTSYNVPASDCGWAVIANNAAPVGFSLVTANYASGYVFTFQNRGAGLLTLTPTAGTIDGGASATLATGNSTSVYFDGTNYWSFPGKGATPGGSSGQFQTNNGAGGFGGAAGTGSGTKVATATAAGTSGNCAKWDASGNVADAGAACGSASPSPVTGSIQYYPVWPQMATGSGAAPSTTTQYCAPFMLASAQHWDQVSVYMTTGAGSTGIQIALYSDATDANGRHYPATVLANSATIADTGSAGNLTWSLTSQALPAGMSWLCFQMGDTTAKYVSLPGSTGGSQYIAGLLGSASLSDVATNGAVITGYTYTSTFGTWANQSAVGTILKSSSIIPNAAYRLASAP